MRARIALTGATLLWILVACSPDNSTSEIAIRSSEKPATPTAEPTDSLVVTNVDIDSATGLKKSDNWELVRNNCLACHSSKLITQQRGSASQWLAMIRWMQKTQNLWQFDQDTETRIIDYLASNYPAKAERRRPAISPALMPRNPYSATNVASHATGEIRMVVPDRP